MKHLKILIFCTLIMIINGCTPVEKPFIIVGKDISTSGETRWFYTYQDKNGRFGEFTEQKEKYNIGDTIK